MIYQPTNQLLIRVVLLWVVFHDLLDCCRYLLAVLFISLIRLSIYLILSGTLFYLSLIMGLFFFVWVLEMLDIIFMCSFPFLAYLFIDGSFSPIKMTEMLSVEPLVIAYNNKAYELLLYHSYLEKPDSWIFFTISTTSLFSTLSHRPSLAITIKSW